MNCEAHADKKLKPLRRRHFTHKLRALFFSVRLIRVCRTCFPYLRTLCASRAYAFVPSFLRALRGFPFLRAIVPSFLTSITFLCVLCALSAFTFYKKCETTHNQLQQSGRSKNKVEYTKNSICKPKQLRAILEINF